MIKVFTYYYYYYYYAYYYTPQKVDFITYFFPLSTKYSVESPLFIQFTSAVIVAKTDQHRTKEFAL